MEDHGIIILTQDKLLKAYLEEEKEDFLCSYLFTSSGSYYRCLYNQFRDV